MHSIDPTYGLVPAEVAAGMSGLEFLRAMIEGRLPRPPIGRPLTFALVEAGEGYAVFEGDPGEHLLSPLGSVHGGWALTLIDSAAGCAGHTLLPAGVGYTTIETKANFCRPIHPDSGRVRARGRVVSSGRRIISAEALISAADGRVLAHGTSTLLILSEDRPGEHPHGRRRT